MASSIQQRIDALRRRIEKFNEKYYVEAASEISDREFDRLMERLQDLEQQHPTEGAATGLCPAACHEH